LTGSVISGTVIFRPAVGSKAASTPSPRVRVQENAAAAPHLPMVDSISTRRPWLTLSALTLSATLACGNGSEDSPNTDGGSSGTAGAGALGGKGGFDGKGGSGGQGATGGAGGTNGGSAGKGGSGGLTGGIGGSAGKAGSGGGAGLPTGGSGGASGDGAGGGGTGGGGASGDGGSAGGGGSATGGTGGGCASDMCPFATGVESMCRKRFMYGLNYAWENFAGDFGGGSRGIAATRDTINGTLGQMASNGANVIRWWVWPNFTGNGVTFDDGGTPTGLTGTTTEDLEALLSLAEEHDLYLMLTLFSFDNFKTMLPENRRMDGIARNAAHRAGLVNVVRAFARAASASPNAHRMLAWDVMNEPEWAVTGPGAGGDEAFDPADDLSAINHAEMHTLLGDVITGLRAESSALVTIGAAAMKWRNAWKDLDQDFYQFHIYDWVQDYWPYTTSPADYGLNDKPLVMGEFPPEGLSDASYRELLDSWYTNGYAGALAWRDATFQVNYPDVKAFADAHPCETAY
jgi:hypothetical protein